MIPINVFKGLSGGATLEELTKMVRDLQIAQARRDGGGQSRDRRPPVDQQCMWRDAIGHAWRDYPDFAEALRRNGWVHACETQKLLGLSG